MKRKLAGEQKKARKLFNYFKFVLDFIVHILTLGRKRTLVSIVWAEDVQTLSHLANYVRVSLTLEYGRTQTRRRRCSQSQRSEQEAWMKQSKGKTCKGGGESEKWNIFLAKYFQFNQTPTNKNANTKAHTHAKPHTHAHKYVLATHTSCHLNKNKHGKWLGILWNTFKHHYISKFFSFLVYAQRRNVSERDLWTVGVACWVCVSGVRMGVAGSHIMATSSLCFAIFSISPLLWLLWHFLIYI